MKRVLYVPIIVFLQLLYGGNVLAVQQAFLIQNSGWMEPFYTDARSEFKPLITALVEAVAEPGKAVTVLTFNQTTPQNESPTIVYNGAFGTGLRDVVRNLKLARKGEGNALADTDFNEAVAKTITGPFKSAPGILWIFTNNKNSPNNSTETAAHNRKFYNLVHAEPSITRSLAFPLSMPVKGHVYSANGLMVYALAYGTEADTHLQSIIAGQQLKKVITQQPAQLKPLDKDAIRLAPKSVINAPNTSATLGSDGHTLILDIDVSSHHPVVKIVTSMENRFYPYCIESATISARIEGKGWANNLPISPGKVEELSPGSVSPDVIVEIPIQAELPKIWSLTSLFDFGRQVRIPAVISIHLENQHLKIDNAFRTRLGEIFPGDPLPDVFVPPASVKESIASIPLLIRVNYPLFPLLIVIGGIIASLIMGIFLFSRTRSVDGYEIVVDGLSRRISLGRFAQQVIMDDTGQQLGVIRRRGGTPTVESVSPGHTVTIRG
jgi:hypothetical protein